MADSGAASFGPGEIPILRQQFEGGARCAEILLDYRHVIGNRLRRADKLVNRPAVWPGIQRQVIGFEGDGHRIGPHRRERVSRQPVAGEIAGVAVLGRAFEARFRWLTIENRFDLIRAEHKPVAVPEHPRRIDVEPVRLLIEKSAIGAGVRHPPDLAIEGHGAMPLGQHALRIWQDPVAFGPSADGKFATAHVPCFRRDSIGAAQDTQCQSHGTAPSFGHAATPRSAAARVQR